MSRVALPLLAASIGSFVAAAERVEGVIRGDRPGATISRHVYGHFAEHLGRCIDGGFWVGEDSPIPNTDGVRDDVVQA